VTADLVAYRSNPEVVATERASRASKETDLPSELPQPARRALVAAGYVRLEQFTQISEAEVLAFHGVGPKALDLLRHALRANGQLFGSGERDRTLT
jgi:hypothetical protein